MALKNNAMPDVINQIYPWKTLTIDTWKKGEIPLWNPFSFSGTVHAGNYQTAVFSPFNLLFFILPFIDAWSILILIQPLLAGIFMYFFLKEIHCLNVGSLIGSIGFMFCGFLVTWMSYGTLGFAILFLPIILWSITRYFRTKSFYAYSVGAFSLMCSFFSGHFQISVYVCIVSFFYVLFETIKSKKHKEGIMLLFMLGIGVLLSSPQLLLTYDAFRASVRSASIQIKEIIPWQYIVTFISPDFFGNPVTRNDWFGHYAEWGGYVGIIPLVLSLYGTFFSEKKDKIFFIGLGILSLLLAYLSPLSIALFELRIPVLSTSAASRIIVITSFSLCVLAAFGYEKLLDSWKKREIRKTILFFSCMAIIFASTWVFVLIIKPISSEYLLIARRNLILPSIFTIIGLFVIGIGFFKQKYWVIIASVSLVLLGCIDSYRFASKWMPFDPKEYVYPNTKIISEIKKVIDINRVYGNIGNEVGSYSQISLIEGYDAMYQARYGEFINALSNGIVYQPGPSVVQFDKAARYALPSFQLLGVKYVLHRLSDGNNVWVFPHWLYPDKFVSRYRDEHYELFEYRDVYPKIFLASSYVIKTDKQEIINTLFQKDFDRRNTLVLERKPNIEPVEGDGTIEKINQTPTRMSVKVINAVPKLLFRSETFDQGWNVMIDNKPSPLYRADYDFQAVLVPEGEHVITFYYWPESLTYACVAMLVGFCMLAGVFIINKKK